VRAILPSGEATDVATRLRLNVPELRRSRDLMFVKLRQQGTSVAEIAAMYRLTERQVYYRLAQVPEHARRRALAV
jgi:transposase